MNQASVRTICAAAVAAALCPVLSAQGDSEVQQGFAILPVPLNLQGLNRSLVGRGSYIVNGAGTCGRCHTPGARYLAGGNPFAGQPEVLNTANFLGGGHLFAGVLVRNITPDSRGLPGGLTLHEFVLTMRTGIDLKAQPSDLLQVMPWPDLRKMADQDLRAIYEYLKSDPLRSRRTGSERHALRAVGTVSSRQRASVLYTRVLRAATARERWTPHSLHGPITNVRDRRLE